jgi:hypothetical protein
MPPLLVKMGPMNDWDVWVDMIKENIKVVHALLFAGHQFWRNTDRGAVSGCQRRQMFLCFVRAGHFWLRFAHFLLPDVGRYRIAETSVAASEMDLK